MRRVLHGLLSLIILLAAGTSVGAAGAAPGFHRAELPNRLPGLNLAAITDITGDGQLDLVGAGPTGLFVLPGNGSKRFPNWYRAADDITYVSYLASADFNRDGLIDIVAGGVRDPDNPTNGWILRVFLGEPGGRFHRVLELGPDAVGSVSVPRTGDFNGDGIPDFVIGRIEWYTKPGQIGAESRGVLDTYLSDGHGGFTGPIHTTQGDMFAGVFFTADCNADGKADAITVAGADRTMNVWLADGSGGFPSRLVLTPPARPSDLLLDSGPPKPGAIIDGDLNGDGLLDLLVRFRYQARSAADPVYGDTREFSALYFGDGSGRFGAPVLLVEPRDHRRTVIRQAVADLNGDGHADIVLSGTNAFKEPGPLFGLQPATDVYLGSAAGSFTGPILSTATGGAFALATDNSGRLRDLDGDGLLDLVTSGAPAGLSIAPGDGTGHFGLGYPTGAFDDYWGGGATTGDFNGDGTIDIAVANSGSHSVSIWLADGAGGWTGPVNYATPDTHAPTSIVAADFNGDGTLDLATASSSFKARPGISILNGDGAGHFVLGRQLLASEPVALVAADFDRDGAIDLAAASNGTRTVDIIYDVPGAARLVTLIDWTDPEDGVDTALAGLAVADFDRNGLLDLARSSASGVLDVFLNVGDPALQRIVRVPMGSMNYAIAAGDLDGDGAPDIAVPSYDRGHGIIIVTRGDGAGGFSPPARYPLFEDVPPHNVAIADLDGHGQRAVVTNLGNALQVLIADAAGSLSAPTKFRDVSTPSLVRHVELADLNRDGLLDAVLPQEVFWNLGTCGDGRVDVNEECDDGNSTDCDGCSTSCRLEPGGACGDGVVSATCHEECDAGSENDDTRPDACRTNCHRPTCGDGVLDSGEECDDGNTISCDGCSASCRLDPAPVCGDGIVNSGCGEQCDDGNRIDGDGCSAGCEHELIPGGGPVSTDCIAEWVVANPTNIPRVDSRGRFSRVQICRDNDPSCDFDGGVIGRCTFHVALCVNITDRALPRCKGAALAGYTVITPSASQAAGSGMAATLRARVDSMAEVMRTQAFGTCAPPADFTIPVGRQPVKIRATTVTKKNDTDRLVFICQP